MDYFNKMDGASGYVRASLLGMSQGMSHLHDPMRLHSALHSAVQVSEANKEAGALLRPLSEYPHLPLLPFTTSPFLHHTLDPRLPFPPSAFHPLHHKPVVSSSAGLCLSTPTVTCSGAGGGSAFSPLPAKCAKMEIETSTSIPVSISASSASIFSHNMLAASIDARNAFLGGLSPPGLNSNCGILEDRRDSPSPRGSHGSRDSPAHARDADTPNSTSDENRGRKLRPGESWCPVCGAPIRAAEYEAHLGLELEKLAQLVTGSNGGQQQRGSPPTSGLAGLHGPISPLSNARGKDPGWETYERVRNNRMQRVRSKRKRTGRSEEIACPVCGDRLTSADDLSHHMEQCLRRGPFLNTRLYLQPGGGGAGRESGLGVGGRCLGASAAQGGTEDEVVDVEGDGPPMEDYDWPGGRSVRGGASRPLPPPVTHDSQRENESDGSKCSEKEPRAAEERTGENGAGAGGVGDAVEREMEELKEKIRVLERNNNGDVENHNSKQQQLFHCLVCRNQYDRPAVSIVCWHVMCEACWSNSLGVKTECPQCSQTMASEDLRLIYL